MKKGFIIIISGPSGAGKTTLHNKLLEDNEFRTKIVKSISATTRPKRPGERHGRDYYYLSKKMFVYKIRAGHFLEWQKVFKYYYGTPLRKVKELLKKGQHVLLCIDVKGAKVVWRKFPQALKIFIRPTSLAVLKARLKKRGTENLQDLKIRMQTAKQELREAPYYDLVVVNGDLHMAYNKIKRFLAARI